MQAPLSAFVPSPLAARLRQPLTTNIVEGR